jgi:hypothetical protein
VARCWESGLGSRRRRGAYSDSDRDGEVAGCCSVAEGEEGVRRSGSSRSILVPGECTLCAGALLLFFFFCFSMFF